MSESENRGIEKLRGSLTDAPIVLFRAEEAMHEYDRSIGRRGSRLRRFMEVVGEGKRCIGPDSGGGLKRSNA
jgi:hypothetical protein